MHYFAVVVDKATGEAVIQREASSADAADSLLRRLTTNTAYADGSKYNSGVLFTSDPAQVPLDLLNDSSEDL